MYFSKKKKKIGEHGTQYLSEAWTYINETTKNKNT